MGFHPIIFILAGYRDMHKSLEEFEIWPDPTTDYGVIKNPHILIMGKTLLPLFSAVFDQILYILAGNDDIHKSMDEFKILRDLSTDYRVRWH